MTELTIITGAGSPGGLGQAVAHRLIDGGGRVALVDLNVEGARLNAEKLAGPDGAARGYECDVSSRASVFETAARIETEMGPAWGLVNGAAGGAYGKPEDIDEDGWRRGLDILVGGCLWWSQAVFPQMKAAGGGRIVNFGSDVSDRPEPGHNMINYLTAKGAVRALTRGLATEWGEHGITVNTVWPVAATPPQRKWADANPERVATQLSRTALHRYGDPDEDIAPVVEFLLGPGGGFVSGATIPADGGRAML